MVVDFSGYEIINLGRSEPVNIMDMIKTIESVTGKKANLVHKELHCADVPYTYANIEKARKILGYNPNISFTDGVKAYIDWYKNVDSLKTASYV